MKKLLLSRVRSYLLLLTFFSFVWSVTLAQQPSLKTQSDNPQQVTGHNNLRKLSKINDQQASGTDAKPASVGDDAQLRRLYEIEILKDPVTGMIPEDIREKELQFAERLSERMGKSARRNARVINDWSARGPYNVGGRTRALALDIENENIILAGGVSGGMWRSEDAGLTWFKTTGSSEIHSVTAVVQDPRPGHRHIWYYSTGERIGNSASAGGAFFGGNGIYKSMDGGQTWNILPASADNLPQANTPLDIAFNLAIHPSTGDLYIATWEGIHRSTDGGASFHVALAGTRDNWSDVMITPNGVIYAAYESFGAGNKGIFRSLDGNNWTNITPAGFPQAGVTDWGRTVLGYTPSNENIVYIFANNLSNSQGYLWRYTHDDVSPAWTNLTANIPLFGGSVGNLNTQGGYNMFVKVHPNNANIIFIGATNLYRSTNGFTSTTGTRWIGGYSPLNNVSVYPNQHPDHHALLFYPSNPNRALSGTDGGLHYTDDILATNAGTLPVLWTSRNNGYLTTQPYTVSIIPTGTQEHLIAGFQDNGSWFTSSTSLASPWSEEFGGDGSYNAFADGGLTRYVSSQRGNIYRLNYASPDAHSDHWVSFTRVTPTGATGFAFIAPFILDPNNDNIMYLPAGRTIWRNDNLDGIPLGSNATTTVNWNNLTNSEVPLNNTISALAISRMPANRLYYGTNQGRIYRVDNANIGNPTKTDISTGKGLPIGNVICITIDPANADRVFAVFSNYNILSIFYSSDGGNGWTNISGNLEETPTGAGSGPSVRWLAIEGNSDRYYVGTSTGLYATTTLDGPATVWIQEDVNGIGNVVVPMIKTRDDGFVAVATHGNGLYSAKFEVTPLPEPSLKVVNAIDDFEVYINSPNTIIDISNVFESTKGDPISYALINTNPSLLTASLNGSLLVISYAANATGKGTIGIVASTASESISEAVNITVRNLEYVLYNQNFPAFNNRPSQLFTDFGNALAQSADDFTIPAGQTWKIEKVFAPGVANGTPVFNNVRVVMYADNAGKPGAEVYNSGVLVPASGTSSTNLELVLTTPASLTAGKYWMSVFVQHAFNPGGVQWFWSATNNVSGSQGHFRDASNLFGRGAIDWTPLGTTFGTVPIDMIFILFGGGTGIPAPAAPSNLNVLYSTNTKFNLQWTDNASNELGFLIERSTNGTSFAPRATVGPNVSQYSDTDFFDRELTYYYRVASIGISDTSSYSNVDSMAIPPDVPVATLATFVLPTSFVANWNAAVGANHYELDVYIDNNQYLPGFNGKVVNGTSFTVTGTKATKQYHYVVRSVNAWGESANSNEIIVAMVKNLQLAAVCSDDPETFRKWRITNPNPFHIEVQWHLYGTDQSGTHSAPPGQSYFTNNTVPGENIMTITWLDDKLETHIVAKSSTKAQCTVSMEAAREYADDDAIETDSPFIINVYPNPTQDKFHIMIASPFEQEVEMEIYSMKGERLFNTKTFSNKIVEVNATSYPGGLYILKAKHMMYNKTFKLVKQ